MSKTSIFFDELCDIVDEDVSLLGIKVTRNLTQFGELPELNGFFANWVFYNTDYDEYILVMYTSVDGSEDNQFSVVMRPSNYGAIVSWDTGIKMVVNKPALDW